MQPWLLLALVLVLLTITSIFFIVAVIVIVAAFIITINIIDVKHILFLVLTSHLFFLPYFGTIYKTLYMFKLLNLYIRHTVMSVSICQFNKLVLGFRKQIK